MTENIKNNGYSLSNPKSKYWATQADYDNLMKILKRDIFSANMVIYNSMPLTVTLNGQVSNNYAGNYFLYSKDLSKIKM